MQILSVGIRQFSSSSRHPFRWAVVTIGTLGALLLSLGCVERVVVIESNPTGAMVRINGVQEGQTPFTKKLSWGEDDLHTITVYAENYEGQQRSLGYREAKEKKSPWKLHKFELPALVESYEINITSNPQGATVYVDGKPDKATPLTTEVFFSRRSSRSPWSNIDIMMEKDQYETTAFRLTRDQASQNKSFHVVLPPLVATYDVEIITNPAGAQIQIDGRDAGKSHLKVPITFTRRTSQSSWSSPIVKAILDNYETQSTKALYDEISRTRRIQIELPEIRREVSVVINSNVDAAQVQVDGAPAGNTPLRHTFVFQRSQSGAPWNSHHIVVSKDNYRHRPKDGNLPPGENPPFSCRLSIDSPDVAAGKLDVILEPIRFVRTKYRRFVFEGGDVAIEESIRLSQIGEIEREPKLRAVTRITDARPEDAVIESRISVMPDGKAVVYSFPFRIPGVDRDFMNIWMHRGGERTRLTDAETLDLEASVSTDGKWIYFTSNRLSPDQKRFTIWRTQTNGRGGLTKITDSPSSRVDTEPSLSPDGNKLVYTCHLRSAGPPQIWLANSDGTLPTQLRIGQSPSWSPDNSRIVFVAPDSAGRDKVWVMGADGSNPTQLSQGEHEDQFPVWSPDGARIIYASNEAYNDEGLRNFDLWMMNSDGTRKTQLTVNGSDDTRPIISHDGKYIYFFSNRGAQAAGQVALQVWRVELPEE